MPQPSICFQAPDISTGSPQPADDMASRRAALAVSEPRVQLPKTSRVLAPVSIWEPPPQRSTRVPTTSEVLAAAQAPGRLPESIEARIIQAICRPLHPGETHQTGNANRERELYVVLEQLDLIQIHHLLRRLDMDRDNDPIATAFRRLVVERRQRVRGFLADSRRRRTVAGR